MALPRPWKRRILFGCREVVVALLNCLIASLVALGGFSMGGTLPASGTMPFWLSLLLSLVAWILARSVSFTDALQQPWQYFLPIGWNRAHAIYVLRRPGMIIGAILLSPICVLIMGAVFGQLASAGLVVGCLWMCALVVFAESYAERRLPVPVFPVRHPLRAYWQHAFLLVLFGSGVIAALRLVFPAVSHAVVASVLWAARTLDASVLFLSEHPVGVGALIVVSPLYAPFAIHGPVGDFAYLWTCAYFATVCWFAYAQIRQRARLTDDAIEAGRFDDYIEVRDEIDQQVVAWETTVEAHHEQMRTDLARAKEQLPWEIAADPERILFDEQNAWKSPPPEKLHQKLSDFVFEYFTSFVLLAAAFLPILAPRLLVPCLIVGLAILHVSAAMSPSGTPGRAPGLPLRWPQWIALSIGRYRPQRAAACVAIAVFMFMHTQSIAASLLGVVGYALAILSWHLSSAAGECLASKSAELGSVYQLLALLQFAAIVVLLVITGFLSKDGLVGDIFLMIAVLLPGVVGLMLTGAVLLFFWPRRGATMLTGNNSKENFHLETD